MANYQTIPGVSRVRLGDTVPNPTVNRVDVADGTKGRCILLSNDWVAVTVAFTEEPVKGMYFVDKDILMKYANLRIRGSIYYVALVARLNTDAKGAPIDDSFRIEYLRLSESVYNEFAEDALEMGNFQTVALSKVKKGEFSYVKPKASAKGIPSKVLSAVRKKLEGFNVDAVMTLVISQLARPFDQYLKACREEGIEVDGTEVPDVFGKLPESVAGTEAIGYDDAEEVSGDEVFSGGDESDEGFDSEDDFPEEE